MLLEVPRLHPDYKTMGLRNYFSLRKAYLEIIGLAEFDHFSINIESDIRELCFLSSSPAVSIELNNSGLIHYDGSVSPTIYKKREFYIWDQVYVNKFSSQIKKIKEYKFNIDKGVVLVKKNK